MTVACILKAKGNSVFSIEANLMLADAAKVLSERRIGAVVVVDAQGTLAGIFSERDIVTAVAGRGADALTRPVADFMTTNVITCARQDSVEQVMEQMTDRRIRHLPVLEQGRLIGLVSIGDVVKRRIEDTVLEAESMRAYIVAG